MMSGHLVNTDKVKKELSKIQDPIEKRTLIQGLVTLARELKKSGNRTKSNEIVAVVSEFID